MRRQRPTVRAGDCPGHISSGDWMFKERRLLIGFLVGLLFAVGYLARMDLTAQHSPSRDRSTNRVGARETGGKVASVDYDSAIDLRPAQTLYDVLKNVRENYVEQIKPEDQGKMTHTALEYMLGSLNDPNTRFLSEDVREALQDAQRGVFHGIGAITAVKRITDGNSKSEHLVIVTTIPSGPAEEAGLMPGDDIVEIDGKWVLPFDPFAKAAAIVKKARANGTAGQKLRKELETEQKRVENGIPIYDAIDLLATSKEAEVELTVFRKGSDKELKLKVSPRQFQCTSVSSSTVGDGKFGLVRVACFTDKTADQFQKAVVDMADRDVDGLILDMRGLAGGDLDTVLTMAGVFCPGKIVSIQVRSSSRRTVLRAPNPAAGVEWKKPFVVLVDQGTARMGEVLAAGLKDNRGAKVVGAQTFGDFGFYSLYDLRDGSAVAMTTGVMLTRKSLNLNGTGLKVDVAAAPASAGQDDNALSVAVKTLAAEVAKS